MARKEKTTNLGTTGQALELGQLNRHWYRRCLDSLGQRLREAGSSPTIRELEELTDHVVTDFLKAVTSQAPGLEAPQFPADRAYFIPFDGDQAKRFNFSKPYYQLISGPELEKERDLENSLWSFLPGSSKDVRIDSDSSVEDGETTSFRQMISPLEVARTRRISGGKGRRLKKSLMLREDRTNLLHQDSLRRALRHGVFRGRLRTAFAEAFEVYRTVPGDADIELILVNQLHVLRWLAVLSGLVTPSGQRGRLGENEDALSTQETDLKRCLEPLLHGYFLNPSQNPTKRQSRILELLIQFVEGEEQLVGEGAKKGASGRLQEELVDLLLKERKALEDQSIFFRTLQEGTNPPAGDGGTEGDDASPGARRITKKVIEKQLGALAPHFTSFFQYFLRPELENELEQRFEGRADDPRRAGTPDLSFVWVCADFDDVDLSLPARSWGRDHSRAVLDRVGESLRRINEPYRKFFRHLEVLLLSENRSAIGNYWRSLGQAARKQRVYASHKDEDRGIVQAPLDHFLDRSAQDDDPYPQNIFLRVRIRDSLKEPVLDGLFVFSNDYDEVRTWGKPQKEREEDVEDLLAFSKVFFFIFRDYLHSLDRARESTDLGKLNQYLFSRRLEELEQLLDRRLQSKEGHYRVEESDVWAETVYALVNNYAHALLDKPPDVRHETFPYDRLIVLPLHDPGAARVRSSQIVLPFYLFQSIFVECLDDKIDGSHYSLLKPFQSSLDLSEAGRARAGDSEAAGEDLARPSRFRARTFQKKFETDDGWEKLPAYLEKHYLGSQTFDALGSIESHVVKTAEDDRGRDWATQALVDFWTEDHPRRTLEVWREFLSRLTEDWQTFSETESRVKGLDAETHWFLFRFGLLSALLRVVDEDDAKLRSLRRLYREQELKLKFGDDPDLDMFWLAGGPVHAARKEREDRRPPDLTGRLLQGQEQAVEGDERGRSTSFYSFFLRQRDPLVLEFLRFLTARVCRGPSWESSEDGARAGVRDEESEATWYQPVLVRPLELEARSKRSKVKSAERAIGHRVPPYDDIEDGVDALGIFLGVVTLQVGRSERETRSFRALVAMIRDFDDSRVGLFQSEREVRERLRSDLEDLTLFTSTFFQTAQRALETARERQKVELLSEDIQQIARYWYSQGIDRVVRALRDELDRLLRRPERPALNVLRPEIVERLFDVVVSVLQHQPEQQSDLGRRGVTLESFTFDRVFHVPLLFGSGQTVPLSYVRTVPADAVKELAVSSSSPTRQDGRRLYDVVRRQGRHESLGGRRKRLDGEPVHVRLPEEEARRLVEAELDGASGSGSEGSPATILDLLVTLSQQRYLEPLVRRLYHASPLQTLTLGGILAYLTDAAALVDREDERETLGPENVAALRHLRRRIRQVLEDTVRSLEPQGDPLSEDLPRTEVAMDGEGYLPSLLGRGTARDEGDGATALAGLLGSSEQVLFLREMFQSLERTHPAGRSGDWAYGLEPDAASKVFYVFYSIPAPEGFLDDLALAPRYRGVFCFVVDDARTDEKSGDASAERADQEDIQTFIHNAINSLRLILQQQALQHLRLQPGVEQFVHGMLHRLKNDLNEPAKSFAKIETAVRRWEQREDEREELLGRIRAGQGTLAGVHDIFHRLKGFTEKGAGGVPLQVFTSESLGWLFVEQLCDAVEKFMEAGEDAEGEDVRREVARLGKACERERIASDTGRAARNGGGPAGPSGDEAPTAAAVQLVEKHLHRLEDLLEEWLRERFEEAGIEVHFSYDVFSTVPLEFRGSYQLPEALNILTENAFQAGWAYLEKHADGRAGERDEAESPVIQLGLICRRSDAREGEILLEFFNSSPGLDPEFKESLNAPVAQPISSQRYSKSGGKKRGGSGFGHYFARQIVSGYCGGREARRHLDIEIEEVAENLCRVRVNLLEARSTRPYSMPVEQLLDEAGKTFKELRHQIGAAGSAGDGEGVPTSRSASCRLSGEIKPSDLMQATRSVLLADRRLKEARLDHIVRNHLCRDLSRAVNRLRGRLEVLLSDRSSDRPDDDLAVSEEAVHLARTMEAELARGAVRQDSFHDLKSWLELWRDREPAGLRALVSLDGRIEEKLEGFFERGELLAADVLSGKQLERIRSELEVFEPYLREEAVGRGPAVLTETLRHDPAGRPTSDPELLSELFVDERWDCVPRWNDSTLRLELSLFDVEDGEPSPAKAGGGAASADGVESRQRVSILEDLPHEPMASTFAQYQAGLAGLDADDGGRPRSSLELVRWLTPEAADGPGPPKPHEVCGRSVSLELELEPAEGGGDPEWQRTGGAL